MKPELSAGTTATLPHPLPPPGLLPLLPFSSSCTGNREVGVALGPALSSINGMWHERALCKLQLPLISFQLSQQEGVERLSAGALSPGPSSPATYASFSHLPIPPS
jgi:hypothetical protein